MAKIPQTGVPALEVTQGAAKDAAFHFGPDGRWELWAQNHDGGRFFWGADAERAATTLLAAANRSGASAFGVRHGVKVLEELADPASDGVAAIAAHVRRREYLKATAPVTFRQINPTERLALEMALHEESERRAMRGELAPLEAAWRDAEKAAAIADGLFLPSGVTDRLEQLRRLTPREQGADDQRAKRPSR